MLGNKDIMAKNIRYYMARQGKTATDICNDLGFKNSTFSNWVNGKIYPRIDKIEMLANYFGISKADLVEEATPSYSRKNGLTTAQFVGEINAQESSQIRRALKYYNMYEQAPKSVQETIDMILKSAQQKP